MNELEEIEILRWQRKSIGLILEQIAYHQYLYSLTNHSKKKEKHKKSIQFNTDVKKSMLIEYGWSLD